MRDEQEQTTEVRKTNEQVGDTNVQKETVRQTSSGASGVVVAQRVVWFLAGFIIVLLALRLVLLLLAANQSSGFVDFVYTLSGMFAAPFYGIFSYEPAYGSSVFEVSTLVAIAVYGLVAWGIAKLLTLTRPQEEV